MNIPIDPDNFVSRRDLFSYLVILDSTFTGKIINVKVIAYNSMGSVTSRSTLLILADVPGKPFPAPTVDSSQTTIT